MNLPRRFPATRYRASALVTQPFRTHTYLGAALRGALGHQLRRQLCATGQPECRGCALLHTCAFPALWAPPAPAHHPAQRFTEVPAPYLIVPPPMGQGRYDAGDVFEFEIVLIGRARKSAALVRSALNAALQQGIGPDLGTARLASWQAEHYANAEGEPQLDLPPPPPAPDTLTLEWRTPLRLQREGRPLRPKEITIDRLLMGLVKRTALLADLHAGLTLDLPFRQLVQEAASVPATAELHWTSINRYSTRQQKRLPLDGVMGRWTLHTVPDTLWPFLWWGQWLHAGKNTTFGLGGYRLIAVPAP